MIKSKQINLLSKRIIEDLEGEDIVLEMKMLNADIHLYNSLLNFFIKNTRYNVEYASGTLKEELPIKIDKSYFMSDYVKDLTITFESNLSVTCGFNEVDFIEFFTNSILRLKPQEFEPLFEFIEKLGDHLKENIYLYVEGCSYPTASFDSFTKNWFLAAI